MVKSTGNRKVNNTEIWDHFGSFEASVENESVLGYESGSEPILLPDFSTNPGPNRFFYLNQILKSL